MSHFDQQVLVKKILCCTICNKRYIYYFLFCLLTVYIQINQVHLNVCIPVINYDIDRSIKHNTFNNIFYQSITILVKSRSLESKQTKIKNENCRSGFIESVHER